MFDAAARDELSSPHVTRNHRASGHAYFKLNQEIHASILRSCGNEALSYVHGILQARLKRIRYIGNERQEKWAGAVADHEEIIAALEARDADRLAAALEAHMTATWNRVKDAI